ncbi:hypothetical protein [Enteractinococcus helveticum]|uniref:hypothetical protein n=1 Tax=Enteractinococcus helveticum TaxID=1837282 RepID=UPI0012377AFD|nr:hypothetical protein [Enteractinococcus helveticum]
MKQRSCRRDQTDTDAAVFASEHHDLPDHRRQARTQYRDQPHTPEPRSCHDGTQDPDTPKQRRDGKTDHADAQYRRQGVGKYSQEVPGQGKHSEV